MNGSDECIKLILGTVINYSKLRRGRVSVELILPQYQDLR